MKILKKVIIITLIYIGLILISTKVLATTGTTIEKTTRLRRNASTSSDVMTLISQGSELEIIGEEEDWYQVKYNAEGKNLIGYIRKDMLTVEESITTTTTSESAEKEEDSQIEIATKNETENQNTTENEEITEINNNEETVTSKETIIEGTNCILKSDADIRILPSINSTIINKFNAATSIKVVEIINKWCKIETEDVSGWILLSKVDNIKANVEVVSATEENEQTNTEEVKEEQKEQTVEVKKENKVLYVATETLNLRKEAKNDGKILKQLSLNDTVEVIEKVDDSWTKVTKNNMTGYVASKYLSETKTEVTSRTLSESRNNENTEENNSKNESSIQEPSETSSKNNSTGEEIVAYAKQYLGYKYVSGGKGPNSFDCSGFTQYVFKHFGITLGGSSSSQINYGTEVSKSNLQPGDLLIFEGWGTTSVGHVGIYIGGNSFIHAANAQKGVIITSLSDSYYSAKYITARRLIK